MCYGKLKEDWESMLLYDNRTICRAEQMTIITWVLIYLLLALW